MKKLALMAAAVFALALGAYGQGAVVVQNATLNPFICNGDANTPYSGNFSMQVWELNASSIPANLAAINGTVGNNGVGNSPDTYGLLATDGFTLGAGKTFTGNMSGANAGIFNFGELDMPSVSPAGGTVVLALAVWANNTGGWGSANSGMAVFKNPTSDYTVSPPLPPPNLTGWDNNGTGPNLVMTPSIPEPSVLALAGLGAAALLIIRRRK